MCMNRYRDQVCSELGFEEGRLKSMVGLSPTP